MKTYTFYKNDVFWNKGVGGFKKNEKKREIKSYERAVSPLQTKELLRPLMWKITTNSDLASCNSVLIRVRSYLRMFLINPQTDPT